MPNGHAEEKTVEKDGYSVTFYPGFMSRCAVDCDGESKEIYKQDGTYHLPGGQTHPARKHTLRFKGGRMNEDFTLQIDDARDRLHKITIELKDRSLSEVGAESTEVETVTVQNDSITCPPNC
ncbi:MAG: hypothetical protein ACREKN_07510 [Longimicrobiaceae bacterium]